jgi:hypothetical protein
MLTNELEEINKQDLAVYPKTIMHLLHYLAGIDDTIASIKRGAMKMEQEVCKLSWRIGCSGEQGKEEL